MLFRCVSFAGALFASHALPASAQEASAELPESAEEAESAPVCDTPVKLGATFYMHDQPDQSLALFRTPKAKISGLYRRGMWVEGYEVVRVEPRGVLLAHADAYCWVRLQPDPSRPPATPPPEPPRKSKKKPKR